MQEVALLVKRLQNRHHRQLDAALAEIGVTLVQWDALRHLDERPGSSLRDLAQLTFQSDQAFGTLAKRMTERGLVTRTDGPGRAVRLEMTPRGTQTLSLAADIVNKTLMHTIGRLSEAERINLAESLRTALHGTAALSGDE